MLGFIWVLLLLTILLKVYILKSSEKLNSIINMIRYEKICLQH